MTRLEWIPVREHWRQEVETVMELVELMHENIMATREDKMKAYSVLRELRNRLEGGEEL